MRQCVDEGILQGYFDGELSGEMTESVASHLASCITCARAARELESENLLLSEALETEFAGPVPTERLRHRVDAAIAGLQVVSPGRTGFAGNAGGTSTPAGLPRRGPRTPWHYPVLTKTNGQCSEFSAVQPGSW